MNGSFEIVVGLFTILLLSYVFYIPFYSTPACLPYRLARMNTITRPIFVVVRVINFSWLRERSIGVFQGMLRVIVITIANIVLIARVAHQKKSIQSANTWRKIRLMVIQLLSVSSIYAVVWIPFAIIALIQIYIDPSFACEFARYVLNYTLYLCPLFSSCLSLTGMPVVRRKVVAFLQRLIYHGRQNPNRVRPNLIALKPLSKQTMEQQQHVSCTIRTQTMC